MEDEKFWGLLATFPEIDQSGAVKRILLAVDSPEKYFARIRAHTKVGSAELVETAGNSGCSKLWQSCRNAQLFPDFLRARNIRSIEQFVKDCSDLNRVLSVGQKLDIFKHIPPRSKL